MTLEISPNSPLLKCFDERCYLAANPDVERAVQHGQFRSGRDHYTQYGYSEARQLGLPTRRQRLLSEIDLSSQRGLEIGALMTPILAKAEADVLFVDHADTATIQAKYTGDPNVDPSRLVPVDIVWQGGSLQRHLPLQFEADFILASHVIEHVPDIIRWLNDLGDALKPDIGMLRLAIPDKRFTFDILRTETRLHDMLDAYLLEAKVPTPHVVLDHCIHFRNIDLQAAWTGALDIESLDHLFPLGAYLELARRAQRGEYLDVHCWVFTPYSFAKAIGQACEMGLIRLSCTDFHLPQPFENEFIVGLKPCSDPVRAGKSWKQMRDFARKAESLSCPSP